MNGNIIYNGIYTGDIRDKDSFAVDDEFRIIHVKRLNHERKGQDLLIRAAAELIHKKGYNNIRVDFIGGGESFDFLNEMIVENSLEKEVKLLGNKDREWIYDNLKNYHLFVHPSRFEGFGLTVTEAMAARLPVISSNIEGPAEILEGGKFGFLFENENVAGLAAKIEEAIKMYSDGSIRELADNAHDHCTQNFNIHLKVNHNL